MRGEHAVITHFVAIKEDVSSRRQLEQQVARSQRLESIGLLTSGIAHDLNNVLAPSLAGVFVIVAWPVAMFFAVVMTGNHFILDAVFGGIVAEFLLRAPLLAGAPAVR